MTEGFFYNELTREIEFYKCKIGFDLYDSDYAILIHQTLHLCSPTQATQNNLDGSELIQEFLVFQEDNI